MDVSEDTATLSTHSGFGGAAVDREPARPGPESGAAVSLQLLEFRTRLLEVVEELHIRRDAETRFEGQISKLVLEKQELEWEKESLVHQIETESKRQTRSLSEVQNQGKYQVAAGLKDKEISSLKEELKTLQLLKYNLEKKSSELEQKLALQSRSKDQHLSQLGQVEKRFSALYRQCAAVKQAHERLQQDVDEAMRMNKKLVTVTGQQEATITSLKKELHDVNNKLVKVRMTAVRQQRSSEAPGGEQRVQQLHHKLSMETELNQKLQEENQAERAEKKEVMRSLQCSHQLVLSHTRTLQRVELELHTQTQKYQALKQEHEALQAGSEAAEAKVARLTESFAASRTRWDKERTTFLDRIRTEREELQEVRRALRDLQGLQLRPSELGQRPRREPDLQMAGGSATLAASPRLFPTSSEERGNAGEAGGSAPQGLDEPRRSEVPGAVTEPAAGQPGPAVPNLQTSPVHMLSSWTGSSLDNDAAASSHLQPDAASLLHDDGCGRKKVCEDRSEDLPMEEENVDINESEEGRKDDGEQEKNSKEEEDGSTEQERLEEEEGSVGEKAERREGADDVREGGAGGGGGGAPGPPETENGVRRAEAAGAQAEIGAPSEAELDPHGQTLQLIATGSEPSDLQQGRSQTVCHSPAQDRHHPNKGDRTRRDLSVSHGPKTICQDVQQDSVNQASLPVYRSDFEKTAQETPPVEETLTGVPPEPRDQTGAAPSPARSDGVTENRETTQRLVGTLNLFDVSGDQEAADQSGPARSPQTQTEALLRVQAEDGGGGGSGASEEGPGQFEPKDPPTGGSGGPQETGSETDWKCGVDASCDVTRKSETCSSKFNKKRPFTASLLDGAAESPPTCRKSFRSLFDWKTTSCRTKADGSGLHPIMQGSSVLSELDAASGSFLVTPPSTSSTFLKNKPSKAPPDIVRASDLLDASGGCRTATSAGRRHAETATPADTNDASLGLSSLDPKLSWQTTTGCSTAPPADGDTEDQPSSFGARISDIERFLSAERLRLSKRRRADD